MKIDEGKNSRLTESVFKKNWIFLIALICLVSANAKIQSQKADSSAVGYQQINIDQHRFNPESANLAQKILIIDSPGKKGKEVEDTTLVVNSELPLYAALYNNGKYKNEATVDWFWADTSHTSLNPRDTSIYLGTGSSIIFKPTKSDTGFIFVKQLPNATGDSTGTIRIIYSEKLLISPAYSIYSTISQGQQNIAVSFLAENIGNFPSIIQEANLQFIDADSQIIINQYLVNRIDTTTIIQPGDTKQFEFLVDAHSNADTGIVLINVQLMTGEAFYTNIEPMHQWLIQIPPILNIDLIDVLVEEVFPGQEDVFVKMHVSNRGGASVNNLNASLTFWRGGQDVSNDYESVMSENNPQFIKGDSSAQINLIVRVNPAATYGTIVINGKISGLDVNTGISYSDEGADLQASWLVTLTSAQVGIVSTRIKCPNMDVIENGEVNIGQKFFVEVLIRNQGTETVRNISVTLMNDGYSKLLTASSYVIPSLFKNQTDTIKYHVEANSATIPIIENFMAQIDSGTSAGGASATINAAFDSLAQVKIVYPANLILKLESSFVQNPIGQTFEVTARVDHSPENASFDSTGQLSIVLPQGYVLVSDRSVLPFKDNEPVTWTIRSPTIPGSADTISISISQIPRDKNDPDQLAQVSVGSAFLIVETLDTFIDITDVAIIEPEGAKDDTISTGQLFCVQAKVKTQLVENNYARIILPLNFDVLDNTTKTINADSISWWLRAPNFVSNFPEQIIIHAWGNVRNDTAKIFSRPDSSLSVWVVSRANLKVTAEIINPPDASQGQISPGLLFQIKGEILNFGEAGVYGDQSLMIDVQDRNSFRVIGDTLLSVENEPAIWTIQASEQLDIIPKIIKVRIVDIPFDENRDEEATINTENQVADVQVFTTVTNIQLMIRQLPEAAPKAIGPGITATMMGIEFTNLSNENGFPVQIKSLKFDVEDKMGNLITPESLISGLRIRNEGAVIGDALSTYHNPVEIPITIPLNIGAQETTQLLIEIDFSNSLSQQFRLNLKDTSYITMESLFPVSIVDEMRNPRSILNLRSHCPVIIENNLKGSFYNYPNPFGTPDRSKTHFIYHLSQDADIELKIYSLIGELVWSCSYKRSDPQGKKGLHQKNDIVWDARNNRGYKVLNGVYIARIKTSYGESALTKIAVIK